MSISVSAKFTSESGNPEISAVYGFAKKVCKNDLQVHSQNCTLRVHVSESAPIVSLAFLISITTDLFEISLQLVVIPPCYLSFKKAKKMLENSEYTCVFCNDDPVLTCQKREVVPLLELLDENKSLEGYSALSEIVIIPDHVRSKRQFRELQNLKLLSLQFTINSENYKTNFHRIKAFF